MLKIILIVLIVLLVMIALMFVLLKNVVKNINESSRSYFTLKLQDYDELVDKKSEELRKIEDFKDKEKKEEKKEEVVTNQEIKQTSVVDFSVPDYQVDNILEKFKEIDKKFVIDNKSVVEKFIKFQEKFRDDTKYELYVNVRKKIEKLDPYKLFLLSNNELNKLLKSELNNDEYIIFQDYNKNKSSISLENFISYIDYEIKNNDPTIYIEVGNPNENYDYLSNNIKTIYNKRIYKGIMITYRNKVYDYSLS